MASGPRSASVAAPAPSRADQYVRMSTEHQQYSPENQLEIIRQYAAAHNVARTTPIIAELSARRTCPMSIIQLTNCGLNPTRFRLIIVKGVHAPVAGYAEVCSSFVRVNSPGLTTAIW